MTDSELWRNFRKGKQWALAKIFRDNYDMLFFYGRGFQFSDEQLKDVIQDLFLKLWNSRERLTSTDKIKPYLLKSFRTILIDYKKKDNQFTTHNIEGYEYPFLASVEEDIITKESNRNLVNKMKSAIQELNPRESELIYLKFYFQLDNQSIAEIMDIKYQSVKNLYMSALTNLRKKMKKD